MKSLDRELSQLRDALHRLAEELRESPAYSWDVRTCHDIAYILDRLAERSARLEAAAPPEFTAQMLRTLIREATTRPADPELAEALKKLAFDAALGGHELSAWRELEGGNLELYCLRCNQTALISGFELRNDLDPICPADLDNA
jgi:hypothetical protein